MVEWFNTAVLKTAGRDERPEGSNPSAPVVTKIFGRLAERFKAADSKSVEHDECSVGSNPTTSGLFVLWIDLTI